MSDIRDPEHSYILVTIHNERELDCIVLGEPERLIVRLRNETRVTFQPSRSGGRVPRIRIDFRQLGDVSFDPQHVVCNGFHVASWTDGVLELEQTAYDFRWLRGFAIDVEIPGVVARGDAGLGFVAVSIEDFDAHADERQRVPLVKLARRESAQRRPAVHWLDEPRIAVRGRNELSEPRTLRIRAARAGEGGGGELIVSLAGRMSVEPVASPLRLQGIDVTGTGGVVRDGGAPLPVWRVASGGAENEIVLANVQSRRLAGNAQVVVYHVGLDEADDGFTVLPLTLDSDPISVSLTAATTASTSNITAPIDVSLTWAVTGATSAILSGVGVLPSMSGKMNVQIEQSTTWVLTAFDSAFQEMKSTQASVTITPPLAERMVPKGTIVAWSGTTPPPHWALCDGSPGTPDLRDRFILGWGSEAPGNRGDADTHTHSIPGRDSTFTTSGDGSHSHQFPSSFVARQYSSGNHEEDWTVASNGSFSSSIRTQNDGVHNHTVAVKFDAAASGQNDGNVRPPWYALAFIIKL